MLKDGATVSHIPQKISAQLHTQCFCIERSVSPAVAMLPLNFHLVFCLPQWNAALLDSKAQLFGNTLNSCCVAIQGCVLRNFRLLLACYLNVRSSKILRMYLSCAPPRSHYKWYWDLWWHTEALLVVAAHRQA